MTGYPMIIVSTSIAGITSQKASLPSRDLLTRGVLSRSAVRTVRLSSTSMDMARLSGRSCLQRGLVNGLFQIGCHLSDRLIHGDLALQRRVRVLLDGERDRVVVGRLRSGVRSEKRRLQLREVGRNLHQRGIAVQALKYRRLVHHGDEDLLARR